MINKLSLIITAIFSLWLFYLTYKLRNENAELKQERNKYEKLFLECNTERMKVQEILIGDSAKTLIYW